MVDGVAAPLIRYRTGLTDSTRWEVVKLRADDIVISTPSKCGTTWMQMICALLVFGDPALPAPLTALSPWVDLSLRPEAEQVELLERQEHRRFLKTHTPLDGLPWRDGVSYVVVARDPRDVAVSMAHHRANLNAQVVPGAERTMAGWPEVVDRIRGWIEDDRPPHLNLSSLTGTAWHLRGAWERRSDPGVLLIHHADLVADLEGEMRRLATALGTPVAEAVWPELVVAATFSSMRARSAALAPNEGLGLLKDDAAFFRSGEPGQWRHAFTPAVLTTYDARIRTLLPADLITWLHR